MRARYGLGLPETIRLFAKLTYNEVLLPPQSPLGSNPAHLYRVTCHVAVTKPVTQWTRVTNVRHQLKSAGGVYSGLDSTLFHEASQRKEIVVPALF